MLRKVLFPVIISIILIIAAVSSARAVDDFGLDRKDFLTCDHFSDNLWGMHTMLEEKIGLSFEILYLQDMFWNTHGGINTHNSGEYPRLFGLYIELDTEKAHLWQNGTFYLALEHLSGNNPSLRQTGDWQWLSWLSKDRRRNQVSEFWYKHTFFEDTLWIKLGKMDANYDFNFIEYSLEFINSSAALNPTIALPSYPNQDWGGVIGIKPADWFSCNFGIYQGKNNGTRSIGGTLDDLRGPMLIVEPSFNYELDGLPGKVNIGAWWNGRRFPAYHEHSSESDYHGKSYGFYGFWQHLIWKENPGAQDCGQGIGLFAEYGWSPEDRSEVEQYVGGGLRWMGAIPTRNDDIMGLGIFNVYFSENAGFRKHYETAYEFFYKAQLAGWLAIQPDIQYIANPGGQYKDAIVLGGRVEFKF